MKKTEGYIEFCKQCELLEENVAYPNEDKKYTFADMAYTWQRAITQTEWITYIGMTIMLIIGIFLGRALFN